MCDFNKTKHHPLVSIIIPVYKVEKYLEECVDSVRNQTYANLEIILVDDGSPDNCGRMCDEFAAEDSRISVIHKTNGGLSDARNAGMKVASGEYLCFVDSDDYIHQDAIAILLKHALAQNADIVCGGYQSFVDGAKFEPEETDSDPVLLDRISAMQQFVQKDWGAWGKLYRRKVHDGVFFPTGKIHEDEAIMLQLLDRCDRIVSLKGKLYYYRTREGSITAQLYSLKKMDWMEGWIANVAFAEDKYPSVYMQCLNKAWTVAMYNIGNLLGNRDAQQHLTVINEFLHSRFTDILSDPFISRNAKIRAVIFRVSDIRKERCLYSRVYGMLKKARGNSNV